MKAGLSGIMIEDQVHFITNKTIVDYEVTSMNMLLYNIGISEALRSH